MPHLNLFNNWKASSWNPQMISVAAYASTQDNLRGLPKLIGLAATKYGTRQWLKRSLRAYEVCLPLSFYEKVSHRFSPKNNQSRKFRVPLLLGGLQGWRSFVRWGWRQSKKRRTNLNTRPENLPLKPSILTKPNLQSFLPEHFFESHCPKSYHSEWDYVFFACPHC